MVAASKISGNDIAKDIAKEIDWPPCQLMVVIAPGPGARARLAAALDCATVAAVLIRAAPNHQLGAGEVKPLVDLAQRYGAAAILFDDVVLARTLRADGVHLIAAADPRAQVASARTALGADASIGVDAGGSRHAAMEAGEGGADYVAFGVSGQRDTGPREVAPNQRDELLAWWAEIFEVPLVALDVHGRDDAAHVARAGADFVALDLAGALGNDDIQRLVADVHDALLRAAAGGDAV